MSMKDTIPVKILIRIVGVVITIYAFWIMGIRGLIGFFLGMAFMTWVLLSNNPFVMIVSQYIERVERSRQFWRADHNDKKTTTTTGHKK